MKLDIPYTRRRADAERDCRERLYHEARTKYGYCSICDDVDARTDFRSFLAERGITYSERTTPIDSGLGAQVIELIYVDAPTGEPRYVYLVEATIEGVWLQSQDKRTLISSDGKSEAMRKEYDLVRSPWVQARYLFSRRLLDSEIYDALNAIEDVDMAVQDAWQEIDRDYPPLWGLVNQSAPCTVMAYHLVTQGWTPAIARIMPRWGAYHYGEGKGMESAFVRSLLEYGRIVLAQPAPRAYVQAMLDTIDEPDYQSLLVEANDSPY